ncbi:hypothetical protein MTR_4g016070 [Medicago truncatula]|uniref:Uncharacterized protein n=1 Tax=Medicago truncatula TaxID=3880 RepID=A0A072UHM0_MEDTR|nr:hypothetical protein MTR_4g016070 [Medicago truncatula]
MISKMISEPLQAPLGHLLLGFCYRATHHLCSRIKPKKIGHEGGVFGKTTKFDYLFRQKFKCKALVTKVL